MSEFSTICCAAVRARARQFNSDPFRVEAQTGISEAGRTS